MSGEAVHVVVGVLEERGRILISKRERNTHLASMWEFPGGKKEAHETEHQALRREMREELGVEIEVGAELGHNLFTYPDRVVRIGFFACTLQPGSPPPRALQVAAFRWVLPEALGVYPFPPANEEIINSLIRERGSSGPIS